MNKFIKLTYTDNTAVLIRLDTVIFFEESIECTKVGTEGGSIAYVKESLAEILSKL